MRLFKFISVSVALVGFVLAILFLIYRNVLVMVHENKDSMQEGLEFVEMTGSLTSLVEFMRRNPQYVSVVSYDLNFPAQGIYFQADTARNIGTTINLFLIIEYARQVHEGIAGPYEFVDLEKIEKFQMPGIREAQHNNAIRNMKRAGMIERDQISLSNVVRLMLEYNNLAAADFLFVKLGPDNVNAIISKLGGGDIEPYHPYVSINRFLVEREGITVAFFDENAGDDRLSVIKESQDWFERFVTDREFSEAVRSKFELEKLNLKFSEEFALHQWFPQAKPVVLASIMEKIVRSTLINSEVSETVRSFLDWSEADRSVRRNFRQYGAIYDSRIGLLAGLDYGRSFYSGQQHVQVVIFENLPIGLWFHMSGNFIQQDYQKRLIFDPELFRLSKERFPNQ